jgi:hypothetical protein
MTFGTTLVIMHSSLFCSPGHI